jgi:hypothetical protein
MGQNFFVTGEIGTTRQNDSDNVATTGLLPTPRTTPLQRGASRSEDLLNEEDTVRKMVKPIAGSATGDDGITTIHVLSIT